jgi:hypothetical protein
MDEEKNGDITSFIEYLIYNNSKIYLEILDKDDDNYTMGPNDVFNFLVDVFLGIMEKRYGVGSTDELNEFEFNERIIEFITTKYLQIGVKLTFCNEDEIDLETIENATLKDFVYMFVNDNKKYIIKFDYICL